MPRSDDIILLPIHRCAVVIDISQSPHPCSHHQSWQSNNHCPHHLPALHPRPDQNKHTQGLPRPVDHAQMSVDSFLLLSHHATYATGANPYRHRLFGEVFLLHVHRYSRCGCCLPIARMLSTYIPS